MSHISYETVMTVTKSWDQAKTFRNFKDVAGNLIFQRVFELEPSLRPMFHFTSDEVLSNNPNFKVHARTMVDMIDMAVSFLGPDLAPVVDYLQELGGRHIKYGVPSEHLPVMERAVMCALDEILHDKFGKAERMAWQTIFHFILTHMTKGMKRSRYTLTCDAFKNDATSKNTTIRPTVQ